ncbi:MAG TPA: RluA family pseudouridine synthase [Usitatibacter sp.]|jgi:23S rRNA pseudouridine1911/1915/1917 synthase|nr:RluA family pseudouridine synthase [Usitatibacter sp.]
MDAPAPTLAAVVRERTGTSWSRAKKLCSDGRVRVNGERCLDPAMRVAPGAVVAVDEHGPRLDKGPLARSAIVFHDRDLVVVDKPPGMLAVADTPGNKETLAEYARILLQRMGGRGSEPGLGVVHRIDRDTSGLMVFARTADAKRNLAAQFRAHGIERVYHAIAHGDVGEATVETDLVMDRGDGLRGSHGHYRRARGDPPGDAKHSVTRVRPLQALSGATLVECRLETGRQHQIRIHLAELGHPLVGERVYIRDYPGPKIDAPRTMLHARTLGFTHPRSGEIMTFEREAPEDFQEASRSLSP